MISLKGSRSIQQFGKKKIKKTFAVEVRIGFLKGLSVFSLVHRGGEGQKLSWRKCPTLMTMSVGPVTSKDRRERRTKKIFWVLQRIPIPARRTKFQGRLLSQLGYWELIAGLSRSWVRTVTLARAAASHECDTRAIPRSASSKHTQCASLHASACKTLLVCYFSNACVYLDALEARIIPPN